MNRVVICLGYQDLTVSHQGQVTEVQEQDKIACSEAFTSTYFYTGCFGMFRPISYLIRCCKQARHFLSYFLNDQSCTTPLSLRLEEPTFKCI